jgi:hypothetical protein
MKGFSSRFTGSRNSLAEHLPSRRQASYSATVTSWRSRQNGATETLRELALPAASPIENARHECHAGATARARIGEQRPDRRLDWLREPLKPPQRDDRRVVRGRRRTILFVTPGFTLFYRDSSVKFAFFELS